MFVLHAQHPSSGFHDKKSSRHLLKSKRICTGGGMLSVFGPWVTSISLSIRACPRAALIARFAQTRIVLPNRCPNLLSTAQVSGGNGCDNMMRLTTSTTPNLAAPPNSYYEIKALSPHHRFVMALHSPDRFAETGLRVCRPEKNARKLACGIRRDTFSSPV